MANSAIPPFLQRPKYTHLKIGTFKNYGYLFVYIRYGLTLAKIHNIGIFIYFSQD